MGGVERYWCEEYVLLVLPGASSSMITGLSEHSHTGALRAYYGVPQICRPRFDSQSGCQPGALVLDTTERTSTLSVALPHITPSQPWHRLFSCTTPSSAQQRCSSPSQPRRRRSPSPTCRCCRRMTTSSPSSRPPPPRHPPSHPRPPSRGHRRQPAARRPKEAAGNLEGTRRRRGRRQTASRTRATRWPCSPGRCAEGCLRTLVSGNCWTVESSASDGGGV